MAEDRLSDMSREELRAFITEVVEEMLAESPPRRGYLLKGDRPMKEVLASMRANLWTPPPDAPSSLEILREDRDR